MSQQLIIFTNKNEVEQIGQFEDYNKWHSYSDLTFHIQAPFSANSIKRLILFVVKYTTRMISHLVVYFI